MDTQTLIHFAHIQTEGAAHITFHFHEVHASWYHVGVILWGGGLSNKRAESYYFVIWRKMHKKNGKQQRILQNDFSLNLRHKEDLVNYFISK